MRKLTKSFISTVFILCVLQLNAQLVIDKNLIDLSSSKDSISFTWELAVSNQGTEILDSLRLNDPLPFPATIVDVTITEQPDSGLLEVNKNYTGDGAGSVVLIRSTSGDTSALLLNDTFRVELTAKTSIDEFSKTPKPIINIGRAVSVIDGNNLNAFARDTLSASLLSIEKSLEDYQVMGDSVWMDFQFVLVNKGTDSLTNPRIRDDMLFDFTLDTVVVIQDQMEGPGVQGNPTYDGNGAGNFITIQNVNNVLACGDSIVVSLRLKTALDTMVNYVIANDSIINRASGIANDEGGTRIDDSDEITINIPVISIDKTLQSSMVMGDSIAFTWELAVSNQGTEILDSLRLNDPLPFPAIIVDVTITEQPDSGLLEVNKNYTGDGAGSVVLIRSTSGDTSALLLNDTFRVELTAKTSIDEFSMTPKPIINIGRAVSVMDGNNLNAFARDTLSASLLSIEKSLEDYQVMGDSVWMDFQFVVVNKGTDSLTNPRIRDDMPFDFTLDTIVVIEDQTSGPGIQGNLSYDGNGAGNFITIQNANNVLACGDSIVVGLQLKTALDTMVNYVIANDSLVNRASGIANNEAGTRIDDSDEITINIPVINIDKTLQSSMVMGDSISFTWELAVSNQGTEILDSLRLEDKLPFTSAINNVEIKQQSSSGKLGLDPTYNGGSDTGVITVMSGDTSTLIPGDTFKVEITLKIGFDEFTAASKPITNLSFTSGMAEGVLVQDEDLDTLRIPMIRSNKQFISSELTTSYDSVQMCFQLSMLNIGTESFDSLRMRDFFPFDFTLDSITIVYQPDGCDLTANDNFKFGGSEHIFTPPSGYDCILECRDSLVIDLKVTSSVNDILPSLADTFYNRLSSIGYTDKGVRTSNVVNIPFVLYDYQPSLASTKAYLGVVEEEDGDLLLSFEFELVNSGNTIIDSLSLIDTLFFFPDALGTPDSFGLSIESIDATMLPGLNPDYDGQTNAEIFDSTGILSPGESFLVTLVISIDPYAFSDLDLALWQNQAIFSGLPKQFTGSPIINPNTGLPYVIGELIDLTDDGTDLPDNGDPLTNNEGAQGNGLGLNDMDDPTPINICETNCGDIGMSKVSHLSLGMDCQVEVTASMVSKFVKPYCDYYFDVDLYDESGNLIPNNTVDSSHLDQLLTVVVKDTADGCENKTWGEILVEDKMPPVIECISDTISCLELNNNPIAPSVEDNCGVEIELFSVSPVSLIDCDTSIIGQVTRRWIATDLSGNKDTCDQTVYLERFDVAAVVGPPQRFILECSSGFDTDSKGNPDPSVSGAPTLDGKPLYPFTSDMACMSNVTYSDEVDVMPCRTVITRKWIVGEWWCGDFIDKRFLQIIEIVDTLAPALTNLPEDITVSTGSKVCSATVNIPPIHWSDACGSSVDVDIFINDDQMLDTNGGVVELEAGVNEVVYEVKDFCTNIAFDTMYITVIDQKAPVVICKTNTSTSINSNGDAKLNAVDLNNGSFDECTDVTFLARRMDITCKPDADQWSDVIHFCCADAGQDVMVALQVSDEGGNTNMCMVTVEVSDKHPATMMCLPYEVALCTDNFDLDSLRLEYGFPTVVDNCPSINNVVEVVTDNRNECGRGAIIRTFTLRDVNDDILQVCEQVIQVDGDTELDEAMIDWPDDFETMDLCSKDDLEPKNLPDSLGMVRLPEGMCNLLSIKFTDDTLSGTQSGDACFKILRNWKVIDWCEQEEGSIINEFPTYEHEQIIKVVNTIPPTILSTCTDTVFSSVDVDCGPITLTLRIDANDDCTPKEELIILYEIDAFDDGGIYISGKGSQLTAEFPIGVHRIFWEVLDRCGQVSRCDYTFEVRNDKAPTPICLDNLSTQLTPMRLDIGMVDTALVMLEPKFFNGGSNHPCGYPISFSFSQDIMDTMRVFGCGDVGEQPIRLHVTDINGNQSVCETSVIIRADSVDAICNPITMMAKVSGSIYTEAGESVEEVAVSLLGSELPAEFTDNEGEYSFSDLATGGNYTVNPSKADDLHNGVSTLDIVILQRHILGFAEITSPIKLLAADVNNDGKLSATDIIELRKVVLGVYDDFTNNEVWRFLDAQYKFYDLKSPWHEEAPERYKISTLSNDMIVDFIGFKTGDINGDALPKSRTELLKKRSDEKWMLTSTNQWVNAGDISTMTFGSKDLHGWQGMQLNLVYRDLEILDIYGKGLQITNSHYRISNGELRMSSAEEMNKTEDGELFTMKIKAKRSGYLKDMINISDQYFDTEAYIGNELTIKSIGLDWQELEYGSLILHQNSPNPWSDLTNIGFTLPSDGQVRINIRDAAGKLLKTILGYYPAGRNEISLEGNDLPPSGILIYEIQHDDQLLNRRMIRVK